jgi:hypothetical protein
VGTLKGVLRTQTSSKRTSSSIIVSDKDVAALPIWLKVKRSGTKLSFQRSGDGSSYAEVATKDIGTGTGQIVLQENTLIGLAASGGGTGSTRVDYREVAGVPALPEFSSAPPPNAPQDLAAAPGDRKVTLSWADPVGGATFTGFGVARDGAKIADLPASQKSYTDGNLVNGTQYCYVVQATRGAVVSPNSNQACGTPEGGGGTFRRGDADSNGGLELTDAIYVLNNQFLGGPDPICMDAADADDSGAYDLTDAIYSLNFQFLGAAAPPSPGPTACGPDPTADSFPACGAPCN